MRFCSKPMSSAFVHSLSSLQGPNWPLGMGQWRCFREVWSHCCEVHQRCHLPTSLLSAGYMSRDKPEEAWKSGRTEYLSSYQETHLSPYLQGAKSACNLTCDFRPLRESILAPLRPFISQFIGHMGVWGTLIQIFIQTRYSFNRCWQLIMSFDSLTWNNSFFLLYRHVFYASWAHSA
jgi:hypothetical protein